jgi:hypothetical protein
LRWRSFACGGRSGRQASCHFFDDFAEQFAVWFGTAAQGIVNPFSVIWQIRRCPGDQLCDRKIEDFANFDELGQRRIGQAALGSGNRFSLDPHALGKLVLGQTPRATQLSEALSKIESAIDFARLNHLVLSSATATLAGQFLASSNA